MPRSPNCTGTPLFGTTKSIAITYPAIDETNDLTTELPTEEPETAQVSYTITSGHLPVMSFPIAFFYAPTLWVRVQNTSGVNRTVSCNVLVNGESIATATSATIANNRYACLTAGQWYDTVIAVGDVITVKLWASGAGVSLLDHTLSAGASRIGYGGMKPVGIMWCGAIGSPPTLGLVLEDEGTNGPTYGTKDETNMLTHSEFAASMEIWDGYTPILTVIDPDYGLFVLSVGDYSSEVVWAVSATSPTVNVQVRPTFISFIPLNLQIRVPSIA